ncbi:MAG TPA: hypothetical protein VFP68_05935 [Burkholderiaceae bacterium]|nr:hypothetical protein [Burkholderiaceae bacterium]
MPWCPWWFAFLVLTIAAERLEMTRLMRRREGASQALCAIFGIMLLGAVLSAWSGIWGGALYGLSLAGLPIWLMTFDIAWRTVRAQGLSRYMADCLLLGYLWLFIAGAAWMAASFGLPFRDAALHALALGFVFSMMLGHAPAILPAIARVKVLLDGGTTCPWLCCMARLPFDSSRAGGTSIRSPTARWATQSPLRCFSAPWPGRQLPGASNTRHRIRSNIMTSLLNIEERPRSGPQRFVLFALGFRPFYLLASVFAALSRYRETGTRRHAMSS